MIGPGDGTQKQDRHDLSSKEHSRIKEEMYVNVIIQIRTRKQKKCLFNLIAISQPLEIHEEL